MSKEQEVYEELCLIDIKQRYSGSPAGLQYIQDIINSQKGRRHPDPKACFLSLIVWFDLVLIECPLQFSKNDDYKVYRVFKHRSTKSI